MHKNSKSDSYAAAGVDVTAGYQVVDKIKPLVKSTYIDGVLGGIGDFGGQFAPNLTGMTRPILVSGTDGVGTKLKIAFLLDKHDTVGIDCVAMCVNDVICCGAKPLFFLDYIACGKNVPERIAELVSGVAEGCVQAGSALIGGETAEMPGFYPVDEYDLAGFSVGCPTGMSNTTGSFQRISIVCFLDQIRKTAFRLYYLCQGIAIADCKSCRVIPSILQF